MATKNQVFPKPHIVAEDLRSKSFAVTIDRFDYKEVNDPKKKGQAVDAKKRVPVLYFKEAKKYLILNPTNWDGVVEATGKKDSDEWGGQTIVLYPTTEKAFGQTWDVVRISKPVQGEKHDTLPDLPDPVEDEEIFGELSVEDRYWASVSSVGLSTKEGQDILTEKGNDFAAALEVIQKQYTPPSDTEAVPA